MPIYQGQCSVPDPTTGPHNFLEGPTDRRRGRHVSSQIMLLVGNCPRSICCVPSSPSHSSNPDPTTSPSPSPSWWHPQEPRTCRRSLHVAGSGTETWASTALMGAWVFAGDAGDNQFAIEHRWIIDQSVTLEGTITMVRADCLGDHSGGAPRGPATRSGVAPVRPRRLTALHCLLLFPRWLVLPQS